MQIFDILRRLPHRYPMLLVDKVQNCEPGVKIQAIKNVSFNEPFFQGHFPERPIMPGVLILEALAQASGLLAFRTMEVENGGLAWEDTPNKPLFLFVGIDKGRFKRPVFPGDTLQLEVVYKRQVRGIWMFDAEALVDGEICASSELMCAARDLPL
jgi:3-hydroxyacyl-[acyl-carrier-protein] dehydratase